MDEFLDVHDIRITLFVSICGTSVKVLMHIPAYTVLDQISSILNFQVILFDQYFLAYILVGYICAGCNFGVTFVSVTS